MPENGLVRDVFNLQLIEEMGRQLQAVYSDFLFKDFIKAASNFIPEDSFKFRNETICNALIEFLPKNYPQGVNIITQTLKPAKNERTFQNFFFMPYASYVEKLGCKKEYLTISFNTLKEITKRFTSEFAIRTFLINFETETLTVLKKWISDENHHVRRLVSEGSRPRLPWAQALPKFKIDPTPTLQLLELLKNDDSKYVQKSVANHLNDITKDNPKLVLSMLARWKKENNPNTNWIIKHAIRNELKKGTPAALHILGYSTNLKLEVNNFQLSTNKIEIGSEINFQFNITNLGSKTEPIMIDYICHFMKANGKTAPKTFKLKTAAIQQGESIYFSKKQSFKLISTRKLYSGEHKIEIFINGKPYDSKAFILNA